MVLAFARIHSLVYLLCTGLDPETRGWTISNSEKIREVHNSFARSDPFHLEENRPQDEHEDAYHFIAYLPIGDKLYELDGLKPMPVSHGEIPGGREKWTDLARECVARSLPWRR
jgi:ubiquitin carboxyl-terminal hydrolase L5